MAIYHLTYWSKTLNLATSVTVTVPDPFKDAPEGSDPLEALSQGKKYPTVYLCHGGSGSNLDWTRYTRAEMYGNKKRVMTVCWDLEESFCCDMKVGRKYFTFSTEELPKFIQAMFPSSPAREDNFVAGFSMGAHCAMKMALRCPEKYAAVWSMSGAKDQVKMTELAKARGINASFDIIESAFGPMDKVRGTENDLVAVAKALADSDRPRPMIFHSCGRQDYGLALCQEYADYLTSIGLKNEFFTPDGIHDYFYADAMLEKAIMEKFPIRQIDY